jgi:hypothetical protein
MKVEDNFRSHHSCLKTIMGLFVNMLLFILLIYEITCDDTFFSKFFLCTLDILLIAYTYSTFIKYSNYKYSKVCEIKRRKLEEVAEHDPKKRDFLAKHNFYLTQSDDRYSLKKISFSQRRINSKIMKNYVEERMRFSSLDPSIIPEIVSMSRNLGLEDYCSEDIARFKLKYNIDLWKVDNGIFDFCRSDFILNEDEKCLYRSECELYENTIALDRSYKHSEVILPIKKVPIYKVDSYDEVTSEHRETKLCGLGVINVTNKRILFKYDLRTIEINYDTIVSFDDINGRLSIAIINSKPLIFDSEDINKLYHAVVYAANNVE